jgi:hypothetical protein
VKTAIISCNLGGFDAHHKWAEQPAVEFRWNDENFPIRKTLGFAMQAKIPKFFAWQMVPECFEAFIFTDACYSLNEGATDYLLKELGDNEFFTFPHPYGRTSIREEGKWILDNMHKPYVKSRYEGEYILKQSSEIERDYKDDLLLHTAIMAYRPTESVKDLFRETWYHISRYCLNEQTIFPYLLRKSGVKFKISDKKILDVPHWTYHRHLKGN